jgi:hypothetical protein
MHLMRTAFSGRPMLDDPEMTQRLLAALKASLPFEVPTSRRHSPAFFENRMSPLLPGTGR